VPGRSYRWTVLVERWQAVQAWGRKMSAELDALPETLRTLREGAANFQVVSERLARTTEKLEAIGALYDSAGATEAVRRLEEAAARLQRQRAALTGTPGVDFVSSAVDEFARTVSSLADLNPFLRRDTSEKKS
jgi:hypothetical protein